MAKRIIKTVTAGAMLATAMTLSPPVLAQNGVSQPTPLPSALPSSASALPSAPVTTTTTTTTTAPLPVKPTVAPGATLMPPPGTTVVLPGVVPPPGDAGALGQTPPMPHAVQDAVNGLQKTDPINLDDMIRAQDAINRLDLLLEIEKRQTELKKLRDDRTKPASLGMGIPASALSPLPMKPASMPPMPKPAAMGSSEAKSSDDYSLKRIIGSDGRYSAIISTGNNKVVSVRAGQKMPDGSKVTSVTLTSVSLMKGRKSKTLTIPSDSYVVRGSESATE